MQRREKRALCLIWLVLAALLVSACARPQPNEKPHQGLLGKGEMEQRFVREESWWKGYGDAILDRYLELALERNLDLAQSSVRIHSALVRAQLAGADLFPTLSAEGSASVRHDLDAGEESRSYQTRLGLQYELDLWQRLRHAANAREWEYHATVADRESLRLSLIHSVVNAYFSLRYLAEGQELQQENIARYREILALEYAKAELGKVAPVTLQQAQQALLSAQAQLHTLAAEEASVRQILGDLLNLRPGELPPLAHAASLLAQNPLSVDLRVPISALAWRPDVQAAESRLAGAFAGMRATSLAWYPALTLGAVLGTEANRSRALFNLPFTSATLGLSLPFLDWQRVRANVRLSEDEYELARLAFIQAITTALNEVRAAYDTSGHSERMLALLLERLQSERVISAYYRDRHELGAGELKDYLEALNTEQNTLLSALQAKYALLRDESTVYRAMGGRFLVR